MTIPNRPARCSGYNAIEMLMVLAVASIVLALGLPALRAMIQSHRLSTTVSDFFAAVYLARSEAIQRGARVDLIPAGDGTDWSKGWTVLIDRNANQRADPADTILFTHGPVDAGIAIKGAFTDSRTQYLAYNGSGRSRTNVSPQSPQLGSWSIALGEEERRIVVNFVGRPRICDPKLKSGPGVC